MAITPDREDAAASQGDQHGAAAAIVDGLRTPPPQKKNVELLGKLYHVGESGVRRTS